MTDRGLVWALAFAGAIGRGDYKWAISVADAALSHWDNESKGGDGPKAA